MFYLTLNLGQQQSHLPVLNQQHSEVIWTGEIMFQEPMGNF
jgi:hypothetical protein